MRFNDHGLVQNQCLKDHEIYNFGSPFLGYDNNIFSVTYLYMARQRQEKFKRNPSMYI